MAFKSKIAISLLLEMNGTFAKLELLECRRQCIFIQLLLDKA